MSIAKRLIIKAGASYDGDFKIVPVNGGYIEVKSSIGLFSVKVNIKNFDGSKAHLSNSFYNLGDPKHLDGSRGNSDEDEPNSPKLRIECKFTPNKPIPGNHLLFGNDFTYPIRDFLPTLLLQTGLKFFTWFISKTVKGDVYNDKPFLYGLALNSFTFISESEKENLQTKLIGVTKDQDFNFLEKLSVVDGAKDSLKIPEKSLDRKKYFNSISHAKEFTFLELIPYILQFDTNFLNMSDSKYSVLIPTFAGKTFDIDVLRYANDTLNNFNWVIKVDGYEGVGFGETGLVLNFALANEELHAAAGSEKEKGAKDTSSKSNLDTNTVD